MEKININKCIEIIWGNKNAKMKLTKIDDDVFVCFDNGLQELVGQLFNGVAIFLFNEPGQYLLLLAQIP
jgi:hypothetical protein